MQLSRSILGQESSKSQRHRVFDKVAASLGSVPLNTSVSHGTLPLNHPVTHETLPLNHPVNAPAGMTHHPVSMWGR